jgi:hypothetical protein
MSPVLKTDHFEADLLNLDEHIERGQFERGQFFTSGLAADLIQ